MDTELRKETPTFVSGGSGPPCRFALVHLASPCGERRRSRRPLRWPSKIAGANPHTNNLLANVEILSCEDNPSEVSASIVAVGRIWRPRNVLQYLPRHARQLGNVGGAVSSRAAMLHVALLKTASSTKR
jgi:hypothetical protein